MTETFTYDDMNRLTGITLKRSPEQDLYCSVVYDALGRMTSRETVTSVNGTPQVTGVFSKPVYHTSKIHALSSAETAEGMFPATPQTVTYTGFDKANKVKQGSDSLCYTYGYDRQRIFMEEHAGVSLHTKRYVGNCEYVTESDGTTTTDHRLTYLTGPYGVFAVVVTKGGVREVYYVLKDNLGSWTTITDGSGVAQQQLGYDAWGNLRDQDTWSGGFSDTPMFDRGFTGHEHLYSFGLINMNGRMYDPVLSSFLSVDQYVQNPSNSQNFNRYAYCLNNPLRYVDPNGELWWEAAIVGAIIGTFSNAAAQVMSGNVNTSGQFWVAGGIGAISGGLGGLFGYQVGYGMNLLLHGAEGFWLGSVAGATSGFAGGFVGGSSAAWMQGASFSKGFWAGMESGGWSALTGLLLGGLEAGYYAKQSGGSFWSGDRMVVAEHHVGNRYEGSKTRAEINAERYNNTSKYLDDVKTIKNRMNRVFKNWESLVSGEIETRSGAYGMTDDLKSYVNLTQSDEKGFEIVDGYIEKRRIGFFSSNVRYDVHIAPGVALYDNVSFKAVVGHELIHSLHYNIFGLNFDLAQSERVAYQYTIDVYNNAGYIQSAQQNLRFAFEKGFFDIVPNPYYYSPF